jgi:NAD+ synthase (glutamine-hydrolysing)
VDLIQSATAKAGGIYLYANHQCCDGTRLYFDGTAMVFCNGELVGRGSQFSPVDVEVVVASVDLEAVRSFRGSTNSRNEQASRVENTLPRITVDFEIAESSYPSGPFRVVPLSQPIQMKYLTPQEEIGFGPACWLWDYLRRSGMSGFFLPLSGGADSSSTASIICTSCIGGAA